MAAKCIREFGIYLGDSADPAVHEDIEIARALESRDQEGLIRLIEARNSSHDLGLQET